jgi:hypothetical protein
MHRRVASGVGGGSLLEIGAGTLNHRRFEKRASTYEIVEPIPRLYQDSGELTRVAAIYPSIHDVPAAARYDRIISIAVLEHVEDLPTLVAACGLRLADGGVFQAGIPAEGGLVWGLAWRMTTGVAYHLRTGLPYAAVMRHEHLSTASEIIAVVGHFFDELKTRWFPLPGRQLAFYGYIEARSPRRDRCARAAQ